MPASSAAKAGHHFVGDELGAVSLCNLRDAAKPSLRLRNHSGRPLHTRFDQQRGVVAPAFFAGGELLLHFVNALEVALPGVARVAAFRLGLVERASVTVWRHHLVRLEQHAGVRLVKKVDVPGADRPDRVAVIRAVERKEPRLAGAPRAACELIGKLERHLDCGRTVVRVKHLAQTRLLLGHAGSRVGQAHQLPAKQ